MNGGIFINKKYNSYLPYIIIQIFIIISIVAFSNHHYITKYYLNKKYPNQVVSLNNDLVHDINKYNYIDLRNSVKETFNRIIVINLNYNISELIKEYEIKLNNLEIELSLDTIRNIAEGKEKAEDYQLIMFLNDDKLIRYQELSKNDTYSFPVIKSKEYKNIYKFRPSNNNHFLLIPYEESINKKSLK